MPLACSQAVQKERNAKTSIFTVTHFKRPKPAEISKGVCGLTGDSGFKEFVRGLVEELVGLLMLERLLQGLIQLLKAHGLDVQRLLCIHIGVVPEDVGKVQHPLVHQVLFLRRRLLFCLLQAMAL